MKRWAGAVAAVIVGTTGMAAVPAGAQDGDAAKGQRVFNTQCRTCHKVEKDASSAVGPSLHGLFGRASGTLEGFQYSEAMKKAAITWSPETLAEYLKDPKGKVPGTKMAYAGLKNPAQLEDLIAYLKEATK